MHGNMYLDALDQLAKRSLGIHYYIRYMDDVIVLSNSKEDLHKYKREFEQFLNEELKLRLNNKTAIRPISQGMEFVGYRIWPGDVRLRKSTSLHMKRHLKDVQELYRKREIDFARANETMQSYLAMMKHCNCYSLRNKVVGEFVLTHNPKEDYERDG